MIIEEDKRSKHIIKRKRRHYIPFESRKSRERSACPYCNSICIKRRHRTRDYRCPVCKWEGAMVKKIMR